MDELEKAFFSACANGNIEKVQELLQTEPSININAIHEELMNCEIPFYSACSEGHLEVVKLLLNDERVDINWTNKNGQTAFYIVCRYRYIEIVKLLLNDKRVDVNKANEDSRTPFYIACYYGCIEIVKLLLNDKRIDINKADVYGQTPFYMTCLKGYLDVVKLLLINNRKEVNLIAKDDEGKSALDIVREKGNEMRGFWETQDHFRKRKRNCASIVNLLESFERDPREARVRLRKKLGLADGDAATLFAIVVLLSDLYFNFKEK